MGAFHDCMNRRHGQEAILAGGKEEKVFLSSPGTKKQKD